MRTNIFVNYFMGTLVSLPLITSASDTPQSPLERELVKELKGLGTIALDCGRLDRYKGKKCTIDFYFVYDENGEKLYSFNDGESSCNANRTVGEGDYFSFFTTNRKCTLVSCLWATDEELKERLEEVRSIQQKARANCYSS